MAELTNPNEIDAELAITADYDVCYDADKARRRVAALRRKLDFPQASGFEGYSMQFAMQAIENQLQQALAWLSANDTPSDARLLRNPSVTHADFSTFRGYTG